jgi:hypothetical protein
MSKSPHLCESCRADPLLRNIPSFDPKSSLRCSSPSWQREGSLFDIVKRLPCGFCELVVHLISPKAVQQTIEWTKNQPDDELKMYKFRLNLQEQTVVIVRWQRAWSNRYQTLGEIRNYPARLAKSFPAHQIGSPQIDTKIFEEAKRRRGAASIGIPIADLSC